MPCRSVVEGVTSNYLLLLLRQLMNFRHGARMLRFLEVAAKIYCGFLFDQVDWP
jgi:hypothetical protein